MSFCATEAAAAAASHVPSVFLPSSAVHPALSSLLTCCSDIDLVTCLKPFL
jgi:hypothetical protein